MKCLLQLLVVCLLALNIPLHAETQTLNGVSFSCTAASHKNINDEIMASDVEVKVTNAAASQRMTMKFNVVITSDQGHVFVSGYKDGKEGKPLSPKSSYNLPFEAMFGTVGTQHEFPKTCQITDLQVCPYYPPAGRAKAMAANPGSAPYYDAFHEGVPAEGCRNAVNLPTVDLPIPDVGPKGCMAVIHGFSTTSPLWNQYGTFVRGYYAFGAATADEALQKAVNAGKADGFDTRFDENNHPDLQDCDHRHGAVVGLRKVATATWQVMPIGIWDRTLARAGDSKASAEQEALRVCAPDPNNPNDYHIKYGVAACEVIASW